MARTSGLANNLFWQTRKLTYEREDHLTYFVAAALESDAQFRRAYERVVLERVNRGGLPPAIQRVHAQFAFPGRRCCVDLLLELKGGKTVACEHKIDAAETTQLNPETGKMRKQLERYLEVPVDGVAYFRPGPAKLPDDIVRHRKYIHPRGREHFLWRDIYSALDAGEEVVTRWLCESFSTLGFTPPVSHVGELFHADPEEAKRNQQNFGKLWDSTRDHANERWDVSIDSRSGLYCYPRRPARCLWAQVSPVPPTGSLLRFRCVTTEERHRSVCDRLTRHAARLPVSVRVESGTRAGRRFVHVFTSLHNLLEGAGSGEEQEQLLYDQVVPLLDAL